MRIAIVTPYYNEDADTLLRCIDSVKAQTCPCSHIMIGDGGARSPATAYADEHIVLPRANGDYGDTPRFIGTVYAYSQGYDAVCWLDADNWLEPNHVESCQEIANMDPSAELVTATRNLYRPDGTFLAVDDESDGENFNDTNCYFVLRSAMATACQWGFKDKRNAVIGDRFVWAVAKTKNRAHNPVPTVNYETKIAYHYVSRNEVPPEDARVIRQRPGTNYFESVPFSSIGAA